jgi:transcription initiation factor TFIID subunit 4
MQRAEMEELRHREANNTALQAIGPRKKLKLDPDATATTVSKNSFQLCIVLLTSP